MKLYPEMTTAQFGAAQKYYATKASLELAKFWEYSANAMDRYVRTGRVDYINNLVGAAINCGRYRAFIRVNKSLCAHEFDEKTRQFVGKADKAKLKRLRKEGEDGIAKWEKMFDEHLAKETEFAQKKPAKDWSMEDKVLALVKACVNHEEGLADVSKALESAWRKVESEKVAKTA